VNRNKIFLRKSDVEIAARRQKSEISGQNCRRERVSSTKMEVFWFKLSTREVTGKIYLHIEWNSIDLKGSILAIKYYHS